MKKNRYWLVSLSIGFIGYLLWQSTSFFSLSNIPSRADKTRTSSTNLRANLGGMRVSIPSYFADYVEFDGDPAAWSEVGSEVLPVRTADSKLRSFGFYVRYPDMAGLSSPELIAQRASQSGVGDPWLSVGFTMGEYYPGDGFLERWVQATVMIPNTILPVSNYEKSPISEYELELYIPAGIDAGTKKPYRQHRDAYDVYIHRDESGVVITTIRCSNRPVLRPRCEQRFNLEPEAKSVVSVHYDRPLVASWNEIMEMVRTLVFSFEASDDAT